MPRKKKIAEDAKVSEVPGTPVETPVEPQVPEAPASPPPAPEPPKPAPLLPTVKDELDDPFGMVGFID